MVERIVVGPMHTNTYVYSEWKKECVLIDPGGDVQKILQRLSLINMKPRGIVLTHGHIDHVCAAGNLKNHFADTGLDVQIAIHEEDGRFLGIRAEAAHLATFGEEGGSGYEDLDSAIDELPEPDVLIADGQKLFDADLLVIHTPGHTPGSICVYSESQELLFSGDTLLFGDVGTTNLPEGDNETLVKSIRERVLILPDATRIFAGHGPFTTIEREKRHNPFLN